MKPYIKTEQRKPLIITLEIAEPHQSYFNDLRKRHFPAHANYLSAHITLFYRLPSDEPLIEETLKELSRRAPLTAEVTHIRHLHNWVAFGMHSAELSALHTTLQQRFHPWLCKQDHKPLSPHITIQNKTTAFKASQLYQQLQPGFEPFTITATSFRTWLYMKGPWKALNTFHFSKTGSPTLL